MGKLYVARRPQRKGLLLPRSATKEKPSLVFLLSPKLDKSRLDELIRKQLDAQGITDEKEVQAIVERAEAQYELDVKVWETEQELKRLMQLKAEGKTLMEKGHRQWKEVYYPARTEFKEPETEV